MAGLGGIFQANPDDPYEGLLMDEHGNLRPPPSEHYVPDLGPMPGVRQHTPESLRDSLRGLPSPGAPVPAPKPEGVPMSNLAPLTHLASSPAGALNLGDFDRRFDALDALSRQRERDFQEFTSNVVLDQHARMPGIPDIEAALAELEADYANQVAAAANPIDGNPLGLDVDEAARQAVADYIASVDAAATPPLETLPDVATALSQDLPPSDFSVPAPQPATRPGGFGTGFGSLDDAGMPNAGLDPARELVQAQAAAQMSQLAREATGLGSAAAGATSPAAQGFGSGLGFAGAPGALASSVPPGGFSYTDDTSIPSPAMASEARSPVQTASLGPMSFSNADYGSMPSAMNEGTNFGGPAGVDIGFSQGSPVSGLMGGMSSSPGGFEAQRSAPTSGFSQSVSNAGFGPSFSADASNAINGLDLTSEIQAATNISNTPPTSNFSSTPATAAPSSVSYASMAPSITPEPVNNLAPLSIDGINTALGRTAAPAAPPQPTRQVSVPAPKPAVRGLTGFNTGLYGRGTPGATGNAGGLFGGNTPTVADVFGANSFQASVFGADTGVLGGGGGFLDTGGLFGSFGSSPSGSGGGSSFAQDVFDQSNNDFGF